MPRKMIRKLRDGKLYYIEQDTIIEKGRIELFTFRDANEILKNCREMNPECCFLIKEFDCN